MAFRSYIHQFRTQGKTSFPVQTSFRTPSNYPVLFRSVCGTFVRKASAIAHVWNRQTCRAWRSEWPRAAARTHWCFSLIWGPVNGVRTLGNNGTGRNGRAAAVVAAGSFVIFIHWVYILFPVTTKRCLCAPLQKFFVENLAGSSRHKNKKKKSSCNLLQKDILLSLPWTCLYHLNRQLVY